MSSLVNFEGFLAFRYLGSKRKEVFISIITIISILSVAISAMVLNMTLAIMTGFQKELRTKLIGVGSEVRIGQFGGKIKDYPLVLDLVKGLDEVEGFIPFSRDQALITSGERGIGVIVRGIHDGSASLSKLTNSLPEGENASEVLRKVKYEDPHSGRISNLPPLIVGENLAKRNGLFKGAVVTLLSPNFTSGPQGLVPRSKRFVVSTTFKSGVNEIDSGVCFTSLSEAERFFGEGVTGIEVDINDPENSGAVKSDMQDLLPSSYFVVDWVDDNKALWEALQLEKRVYYIVLLLLILIATFSVVATMVMVVIEKTRDIAMLKTLGATDGQVLRTFLLQGVLIGGGGTVLGTCLGLIGCFLLKEVGFGIDPDVFQMEEVPVAISYGNFLLVAGSSFIITSLGGLYPARRASKLNPAECLKFD